ncbi:MAG TPA: NADH-quinone oxidoreductase subunit J [Candidatus Kapabacteria bacterium]|nr:NADH-quinone oxidoreductase subunit J [Candidatus Kapabacteria bacterium]
MTLSLLFFSILAVLGISSAIVTVASKHPVKSAMALVFHFFILSGFYLTLNAQFLAVLQVLVYAGAIMVMVVFVVMLLNLGDEEKLKIRYNAKQYLAIGLACALAMMLVSVFVVNFDLRQFDPNLSLNAGTVTALGKELFTNFLLPIEGVAILLTAAIVGSIALAKKKLN